MSSISIAKSRLSVLLCLIFLFLSSVSHAEHKTVRILHVNDFHGFAEPYKPLGSDEFLGGIAYLAAESDRLRKEAPSILIAAGDMIQGHNWANLFKGESAIEVMNAMAFDALVLGNHEFDFGIKILNERISAANFPVLGANVAGLDAIKPYIIKEVGGVRLAIIGIATDETPVTTNPRNVVGLRFHSPEDTLEKILPAIKGKADLVVVLSHIGYANDRILASHIKGVDVIVGGHSHTRPERPALVNGTVVVQAWEHAKALGILDITLEDGRISGYSWRLEEIRPKGVKDNRVEEIVKKYSAKVEATLGQKIGFSQIGLDGENVRRKETNLGNLVTDIMRQTSSAEAAIINGGTIRTSINKGELKAGDIYSVLPFDNYIVAIRLSGAEIRSALEHGVSGVERGEGRFPQISGISFSYSPSAPVGKRVREVVIGGRPLEEGREYIVATNDFLAAGGDGYRAFGDAVKSSPDYSVVGGAMKGEKLVFSDSGRWLRDVVMEFIRERGEIAPQLEGRIKELP